MHTQRHMLRRVLAAGLIGALGLLAACSGPATAPTTSTGSPAAAVTTTTQQTIEATAEAAEATETASAGVAPTAVCDELRAALVRALTLDMTLTEVPVQDPQTGTSSPGCRLSASGSAAELGMFLDVAAKLRTAMTDASWAEDQSLLADGPTGTASGYRKNNVLARTLVEWQPAPGASCPPDQPISACQLTPEQQQLTITLDLARQ